MKREPAQVPLPGYIEHPPLQGAGVPKIGRKPQSQVAAFVEAEVDWAPARLRRGGGIEAGRNAAASRRRTGWRVNSRAASRSG